MEIKKVHCLFEQSGTFKREFLKLGIPAEDYDICNEFGETDHVVDLFSEIDKAYNGEESVFDGIGGDDLVVAFFPCTRFEAYNCMTLQGKQTGLKNWDDVKKLGYSMEKHTELHRMYVLVCKLFSVFLKSGRRMIVENPYTQPHYLTYYFPIEPTILDYDRTKNGDCFKKPTQYWFINCEPENNIILEPLEFVQMRFIAHTNGKEDNKKRDVQRSMIHSQYARRFIVQHVLTCDGGVFKSD